MMEVCYGKSGVFELDRMHRCHGECFSVGFIASEGRYCMLRGLNMQDYEPDGKNDIGSSTIDAVNDAFLEIVHHQKLASYAIACL